MRTQTRARTVLPITPTTIDEAEAEGWQWLSLTCPECRKETLFPFRLLKARTGEQRFDAILPRLRCSVCAVPPGTVQLARHRPPPVYDYLSQFERRPLV